MFNYLISQGGTASARLRSSSPWKPLTKWGRLLLAIAAGVSQALTPISYAVCSERSANIPAKMKAQSCGDEKSEWRGVAALRVVVPCLKFPSWHGGSLSPCQKGVGTPGRRLTCFTSHLQPCPIKSCRPNFIVLNKGSANHVQVIRLDVLIKNRHDVCMHAWCKVFTLVLLVLYCVDFQKIYLCCICCLFLIHTFSWHFFLPSFNILPVSVHCWCLENHFCVHFAFPCLLCALRCG